VQHILVVEDSSTMRALLTASLEEIAGEIKVTEAENGFDALRALPRDSFDLIITDINMPDINGLELVSFVKKNEIYRSIPLIIVSTEGSERDLDRGVSLGADAYIVKPFDPEDLREIVCGLLGRSKSTEG
jgi:two-component system chemotaxis response regulator CheY